MVIRITPWRNHLEWQHIKSCFYDRGLDAEKAQAQALARVEAWSIRGRVPHSVVATSMLTTAMLRDKSGILSALETRMLLAMAITRFVNGLLDPAQQAVYAISMVALARTLGLPESFVEIRHSATHDSLPSLAVLRAALVRALDWLWHNYWDVQVSTDLTKVSKEDNRAELSAQIQRICKAWRRTRIHDPTRPLKAGDNNPVTRDSLALIKEVKAIKCSTITNQVLSETLFSSKNLLSRAKGSQDLWSPLLIPLLSCFPGLRLQMVQDGARQLGLSSRLADESQLHTGQNGTDRASLPRNGEQSDLLQKWVQILTHMSGQPSDNKQIIRALSVEIDQHTMAILESLRDKKDFDSVERALNLRKGLGSGHKVSMLCRTDDQRDNGELDSVDSEQMCCAASNMKCRPIGFLIT